MNSYHQLTTHYQHMQYVDDKYGLYHIIISVSTGLKICCLLHSISNK